MIDLYQLQSEVFDFDFHRIIECISLDANYDKFMHVDGEESDHGIIEYFHNGELFATREIFGGDSEITDLTSYGKSIVADLMIAQINKWKAL